MSTKEYETIELPGVGDIRARPGTSTLELAGAAKFWHDKYQDGRKDGFIAGASLLAMAELLAVCVYYIVRSL